MKDGNERLFEIEKLRLHTEIEKKKLKVGERSGLSSSECHQNLMWPETQDRYDNLVRLKQINMFYNLRKFLNIYSSLKSFGLLLKSTVTGKAMDIYTEFLADYAADSDYVKEAILKRSDLH